MKQIEAAVVRRGRLGDGPSSYRVRLPAIEEVGAGPSPGTVA